MSSIFFCCRYDTSASVMFFFAGIVSQEATYSNRYLHALHHDYRRVRKTGVHAQPAGRQRSQTGVSPKKGRQ